MDCYFADQWYMRNKYASLSAYHTHMGLCDQSWLLYPMLLLKLKINARRKELICCVAQNISLSWNEIAFGINLSDRTNRIQRRFNIMFFTSGIGMNID